MKRVLIWLLLLLTSYAEVSLAQDAAATFDMSPGLELVTSTMPLAPDPQTQPASHRNDVLIRVSIDRSGNVSDATFLFSSGWREMDKSAINAVRTWKFKPLTDVNGSPAEASGKVRVTFF